MHTGDPTHLMLLLADCPPGFAHLRHSTSPLLRLGIDLVLFVTRSHKEVERVFVEGGCEGVSWVEGPLEDDQQDFLRRF